MSCGKVLLPALIGTALIFGSLIYVLPTNPTKPVKVTIVPAPRPATKPAPRPAPKPILPQLAAFTATWCGPCQRAHLVVDEIEKAGLAQVIRIDIDQQPDVANKYGITSVPTFILYREGKEPLSTHDIQEIKTALEKT